VKQFEIKTYPAACLKEKAREITDFKGDIPAIVKAMSGVMYVHRGIGLAATQVGLDIRLLIIDVGDGLQVFANPVFTKRSKKKCKMEEGCLSLPGITVNVSRSEEVEVSAKDINGKQFIRKYKGLMARVLQHEADHLDGKLLIDHLNPIKSAIAIHQLKNAGKRRVIKKDAGEI